jgi:tetratricopeptide (TPR) repeat protein
VPSGYAQVRNPFGVLTNIPLVWLALAAPLAWRNRSAEAVSVLRWFVTAAALLFGTSVLTVGLFWSASFRYEVDFLPALVLLAVVGILGVERMLAARPTRRWAVRWGWGLLLVFSVAFNLLASVAYYAEAHNSLGITLAQLGRPQEAMMHWEQALQIRPDYIEVHKRMADNLRESGKLEEAVQHWEQILRIRPDDADAHNNLGITSEQAGRTQEAIGHYEQALRIEPDFADAHYNLGLALAHLGRVQEAMAQWEQSVRIKPDFAEAHYNLGMTLEQMGKRLEAIGHYQQALQIKPDFTAARTALARLQVGQ